MRAMWAIAVALVFDAKCALVAGDCADCHAPQVRAHAVTAHAHALRPVLSSAFGKNLPDRPIGEARGGYLLEYERVSGGLLVTARRNDDTARGMIEWVFGAGQQGETPLVRIGPRFFEHRISFYARDGRFDLTLGHPPGFSQNAMAALGRQQKPGDVRQCFSCHSTEISEDLRPVIPGVQCERCHPGAGQHAQGQALPLNPGKLDAAAQVRFCGTCHRVQPPEGNNNDPFNVRFQPLRLMMSACFRSGKLACTTCHEAHADARRNDSQFYNARCLQCHADQRQKGNCIGCHMHRDSPSSLLTFTDHYIR